jgi:hypothetical protein
VKRLTLKRGKLSRPSGEWKDEDYDVLADGKVVGAGGLDSERSSHFVGLQWAKSVSPALTALCARNGF